MKHTLFLTLVIAVGVSSTGLREAAEDNPVIMGEYGICNCDCSNNYGLVLNDDFTFSYVDSYQNISKIYGTWHQAGNTVFLEGYTSDKRIPGEWRLDKNDPCLKTRIGFNFIRICNTGICNDLKAAE